MTAETDLALRNRQLPIDILMDDYRSADRLAKHYSNLASKFITDFNLASEATGFIERGSKYGFERDQIGKKMMKLVAKDLVSKRALRELKKTNPSGYFVIKDMSNGVGFSAETAPSLLYAKAKELGVLKKSKI